MEKQATVIFKYVFLKETFIFMNEISLSPICHCWFGQRLDNWPVPRLKKIHRRHLDTASYLMGPRKNSFPRISFSNTYWWFIVRVLLLLVMRSWNIIDDQSTLDQVMAWCREATSQHQGAVSIRKTVLPGMAIPMLKIRRPNGRLIFNMEIAIRR